MGVPYRQGIDTIPLPDPPLADDEIALGPFAEADVPLLVEHCNDPRIAHFTFIPAPYDRRHALEFVGDQDERRRRREAIDLSIRDGSGDTFLGATGLRAFDWSRGIGEIGYWVAPWARGRGIAPRAVALLSAWALDSLPLTRIELPLDSENQASRRVAEKAGFALTREHRRLHAKGREWRMDVYAHQP